ncbi:MAG: hypothetical protein M9933_15680 [Chitinophagaceae bacterium]|nr:hypothetical protein [Chitinophagaceae bacterium]
MIVSNFTDNYLMYENMSIWEIKSIRDFFKAQESLAEIFEVEYGFPYGELHKQTDFRDTDIMIISKLLDHFGDKQFFVFSYNDPHHNELKNLQDRKIINFGMDIHVLNPQRIYVLEMDKSKDIKIYDR